MLTQRDRTTGQLVHVLNGSQRFSEGYLIKSVAVKGLALEDGLPPLDDLQRFQAAAQGGGGGGAGDRAGAADLAGLVQSLTTEGEGQGGAAPTRFAKGDLVLVVQGGGRGPGWLTGCHFVVGIAVERSSGSFRREWGTAWHAWQGITPG